MRLIVVLDGVARPVELPESGSLTIGRGSGVDIEIIHDSISRRHALLHLTRPITVEDCGSVNGTWVSGTRLLPEFRVPIDIGGAFAVGDAVLVLDGRAGDDDEEDDDKDAPKKPAAAQPSPMMQLLATLDAVAKSMLSVLLLGETGVGKEVLAQRVHSSSDRAPRPFVKINCASFPEQLFESELFGYERGAFTGADQRKPGLLESADGGTVFFDELGEMPLAAQAKLLRVIETREVTRLGSTKPHTIDVRFIAATNRDLRELVSQKVFREDLFFRLNGITLRIPPLRERKGELPELTTHLLRDAAKKSSRRRVQTLSPSAMETLRRHEWPGNIRELRNVLERAVVLTPETEDVIPVDKLIFDDDKSESSDSDLISDPPPGLTPEQTQERIRIHRVLIQTGGNQTEAARVLGIARRTLVNRLDAYKLRRPRKLS